MNPNVEKLKELVDDLTAVEGAHRDALSKEPTIARPLHEAAAQAKRRLSQVTEPSEPPKGFVP